MAIVIGGILVAVIGGYLVYRWNLNRKAIIRGEMEESLIDRDTLNVPKDEDADEESD